ncbi:1-acyl-sn-glycerol-3-phosphate acyltransferase alpha-like [Agrilus planipennis]|uniref:1-acyl-sn-glycerol-3-phosphate acyltransferase n=1 Tax=Agrilus planipennis TaxID=224129 RepID=A0A1W4WIK5_AGRPL|nr:1-acyl-sn-glycerol-3-phosphate acyltransferase alpha-like [Agrilus planipennis]
MVFLDYLKILLVGFILLLPFLYESSQYFKYYFKFALYYLLVGYVSLVMIPVFLFKPRNVHNLLLATAICRYISPLIGVQWVLRGKEVLEKENACIIVCNHQSSIDVLGMFDIWHIMRRCTAIAKHELLYAFPFGPAAWLGGLVFVDKSNASRARYQVNVAAEEAKKDNIKLWVYPEGKRNDTGKIHEFKKGAFHMALHAQLPIVPVVFSHFYFLDGYRKRFNSGKVIVTVLPPISTEGLPISKATDLAAETKLAMEKVFYSTSEEVKRNVNWNSSNKQN